MKEKCIRKTITFGAVGNKNCFIKLHNSNQNPTDYTLTLT